MVSTKEQAIAALKKFLDTEDDMSSADARGPYGSFAGSYFDVLFKEKKYRVYKADGKVEQA